MASLLFISGPDRGTVCPIAGGTFTLGRLAGCDVQLSDEKASREHCRIWFDHGHKAYMLADLGSANGTKLNGSLIRRETVLANDDEIAFGQTTLRFCRRTAVWDPSDLPGMIESRVKGEELLVTQ